MTEITDTLVRAPRCVLATVDGVRPAACASPFWWDGGGVWMSGSPVADVADALHEDPRAALHVPVASGTEAGTNAGTGVIVRGRARVFGSHDPAGLVFSWPAIGAALTALALKNAPQLAGYARDLTRLPASRWPTWLRVVRVVADEVAAAPPWPGHDSGGRGLGGLAPALPSVVPPGVRRALSGRRKVTVATVEDGPEVRLAVWSSGMRIGAGGSFAEDTAAAVVIDGARDTLVLEGRIRDGSLVPERVRWWEGLVGGVADVPAPVVGGVELPD